MIKNGIGGGNTITGLNFEKETDLLNILNKIKGYQIDIIKKTKGGLITNANILYENKLIARCFKKAGFYELLREEGVDYKTIISKRLEPDQALYVIVNNTLFIIEIKFQTVAGSVDEKLQTCDFKKKQYIKLMSQLNIEVEYIYILNNWFKKPEYKDVLDYVISANCQYYFQYIPLQKLNLPNPIEQL
jgi:hypothetical protein